MVIQTDLINPIDSITLHKCMHTSTHFSASIQGVGGGGNPRGGGGGHDPQLFTLLTLSPQRSLPTLLSSGTENSNLKNLRKSILAH